MYDERDTAGLDEIARLERELEATMAGADREISLLQDQLSKAEDLVEDLRTDVATAQEERDQAQEQVADLRSQVLFLESQLDESRAVAVEALRSRLEDDEARRRREAFFESQQHQAQVQEREARLLEEQHKAQEREDSLRPRGDWRDQY